MVVLKKSKGKKVKGKRKNMRGGAFGGIYEFTNDNDEIYFFSDLEGNMPDGIKELMFETTTLNGEKKFVMDETGIIEKPKLLENNVIVFTGDLIDRGEYSIRNIRRMLALKEKAGNEGRVILLCGNRDTNKIRMYHECHIKEIEDNILNNANNKEFNIAYIISKLKDISVTPDLFTNKSKDIATIINITGILKDLTIPNTEDPNFVEKYTDDISRIENMYLNTLGSPKQVENFQKEFKVLFGIDNVLSSNTLLKFIAMMNMVMGKIWGDDELPKILEPYNGLYIKYLQQCHIMASITIGDKLCLVSHAGIPYKAIGLEGFYIPTLLGIVPPKVTIDNIGNIDTLNTNFTYFINKLITNGNTVIDDEYKQYVAMSANCDIQSIDGTEFSAYASPIVSRKTLGDVKDIKNLSLDKFKKEGATTTKVYNIFGHQPSGLLPYISKTDVNSITSYHIDLDISRAEDNDISNKESYVYLKMKKDDDMLFGKTESTKVHDIINNIESVKGVLTPININYKNVTLDSYCENSRVDVTYNIDNKIHTSTLFTVDVEEKKEEKKYYGMFLFTLVETNKDIKPNTGIETILLNGGRGKTRIYTKSIKRFLYGKRKMVIYVGKRGGEYVKVKGEYMSLVKFNKKINNKK